MIDTHIHLDATEYAETRNKVIEDARATGVATFVLPGVSPANFAPVQALAEQHQDVVPAYGIHPLYVGDTDESGLEQLRAQLQNGGAVAVGEIGLDYFVADADRTRQEAFYVAQLKLAREFGLPVLLHIRRAQDDVLKHLRRITVRGGIAHAFNGSRQQADTFIAMGFKLGFGGAMTYDGSSRIRALVRDLPLEAIVLETDGPDIPPAWRPGGPSLPSELLRYASLVAELRGDTLERVIAQTGANAVAALPGLTGRL
nr:TatD family hydrolase [Niveibacterium umoris]